MKKIIAFGLLAFLTAGSSVQLPALSVSEFPNRSPQARIVAAQSENSTTLPSRDVFYMSDRFGFRFVEPSDYVIDSSSSTASAEPNSPLEVLEIWRQEDYLQRFDLPEAVPIITITIYRNSQKLPLAQWKGELSHNDDRSLTVAGQPALAYTSTGLYESDNVLLRSPDGGYVFRIKTGYEKASDRIRQVFQDVVNS